MLKRLLNNDNPERSTPGKKSVTEVFTSTDKLEGFDLSSYIDKKNEAPQHYDTKKFKESITDLNENKEEQQNTPENKEANLAEAMLLLWIIDKLISGICGFVSLTFESKKYSVPKNEREELAEYAAPVAAKILEKFPDAILLFIGLSALYGPKVGQAVTDRRAMILKNESTNEKETAKQ